MNSLQELRRKQISEVINADRDISKKVFQQQFKTVQQFQDVLRQPSPMEKKISYEIEKYIIELESLLTDIQNELEQKLAPFEAKILGQVGEADTIEEEEEKKKEREALPIGLVEGSGRTMRGGVKEVKFSLLEIWNKFVNYISKLADLQKFSQNDFIVLYDRLDDLLPLLQSIIRLNQDAKSVDIVPIGEGIVELLQSKISNRDISYITPSKDLPTFSTGIKKKFQDDIIKLKTIIPQLLTKTERSNYARDSISFKQDIANRKTRGKIDEMNKLIEKKKDLDKRFKNTDNLNLTQEDVKSEIDKIEKQLKLGRFPKEIIKASRQALRGQGKTSSSQILKNFDDETYRVYESIPSLSYDQLEDLYIDLEDKRKFAQEHDDKPNWEKYNFLLSTVLSDERAKDIQRILGNGRKSKSDYKYSRTSMPMPFRDADNEMYSY